MQVVPLLLGQAENFAAHPRVYKKRAEKLRVDVRSLKNKSRFNSRKYGCTRKRFNENSRKKRHPTQKLQD